MPSKKETFTLQDAQRAYRWLNAHVFNNELSNKSKIIIRKRTIMFEGTNCFGMYIQSERTIYLNRSKIVGFLDMMETLYHEMCHKYQREVLNLQDAPHSRRFHKIYKTGVCKLRKIIQ